MKITSTDGARTIDTSEFREFIGFDVREDGKLVPGGVINFDHAEARALGEWLLENTPKPPTNQEIWDSFPIGQLFRLGDNEAVCVKVSATQHYHPRTRLLHTTDTDVSYGFVPLNEEEN